MALRSVETTSSIPRLLSQGVTRQVFHLSYFMESFSDPLLDQPSSHSTQMLEGWADFTFEELPDTELLFSPPLESISDEGKGEIIPNDLTHNGDTSPLEIDIPCERQVCFRVEGDHLLLSFPSEGTGINDFPVLPLAWIDVWQQFKQRLQGGERFWTPGTAVHLLSGDRLLDVSQLQDIAESLNELGLELKWVHTRRRQTAVAAATAGYSIQQPGLTGHSARFITSNSTTQKPLADPLYLQTTLRSGSEIIHPGTVVILGDVNPGSVIIADGDILVWGRLRGIAHAGASGNSHCLVMALQMELTQIRIADFVALVPELPPNEHLPEVAYVHNGGIHIIKSSDFNRG